MPEAAPAVPHPSHAPETDVVIVGSGPTGLMAAALLSRWGVNVRILDKSSQLIAHSLVGRNNHIHKTESTQVFEAFGLTSDTPQAIFLVRPDGYIAYRRDGLDVQELGAFVHGRFTDPTKNH